MTARSDRPWQVFSAAAGLSDDPLSRQEILAVSPEFSFALQCAGSGAGCTTWLGAIQLRKDSSGMIEAWSERILTAPALDEAFSEQGG